jgi:hypothetical protein
VLQTGAGSGQDGEGRIGLPLLIPGPSYGVTTCLQAFVVDDGAPTGLAQSSGLLLHVGR